MKNKTELIRSNKESLAENKTKNKIEQLLLIYRHGDNSHEHRKWQIEWATYFVFNLSQRLDLRRSNKHVALHNWSIYYTWKKITKQYEINKHKIIALTWHDEFELPDGSYSASNIQDYVEYVTKNHETLIIVPPIHVYINRVNNRLLFKIKAGCKLELQTLETMALFGSTEKIIDKTKNGEKALRLEVVEVVLVQWSLVNNQYQQNSEVFYTFTPNKSYAYLLNVEQSNLGFLKT